MNRRTILSLLLLALAASVAVALCGCATTKDDDSSPLPWNTPQPWEGAPMIPGLENR